MKLTQMQHQMEETQHQSKELYANIIDRMKSEHHNAVERLTELKNIELQAALTATGRLKLVEEIA